MTGGYWAKSEEENAKGDPRVGQIRLLKLLVSCEFHKSFSIRIKMSPRIIIFYANETTTLKDLLSL